MLLIIFKGITYQTVVRIINLYKPRVFCVSSANLADPDQVP